MGSRPAYLPMFRRIRGRSRRRSVRHRPPSRCRSALAWRRPAIRSTSTAWAPPELGRPAATRVHRVAADGEGVSDLLRHAVLDGERAVAPPPQTAGAAPGRLRSPRSSPATSNASSSATLAGRRGGTPCSTRSPSPRMRASSATANTRRSQRATTRNQAATRETVGARSEHNERTLAHDSYGVMSQHTRCVHNELTGGCCAPPRPPCHRPRVALPVVDRLGADRPRAAGSR